jgi:amidase
VDDLAWLTATEAAAALRSRRVSSTELVRAALERCAAANPAVNAVVELAADAALSRAAEADADLERGEWWGPLHGVPVTVKESFMVAGLHTTVAAPSLRDHVAAVDAAAVACLKRAGAIILGHTNVPVFLGDYQSTNAIYGTTSNPWDTSRTAGGSSGGSAAALAAGIGHLSIGSDLGGSIRVPAHFCGVYGHKPTLGVVPLEGHVPPPPGVSPGPPSELAVAGPMARSADDLLLALQALGGAVGDDAAAYTWRLPPARRSQPDDYRIGFVLDDPVCPVTAGVRDALARAVEALAAAGATVSEGWPPGLDPAQQVRDYRLMLLAFFQAMAPEEPAPPLVTYREHARVNRQRMAARALWQTFFREVDAFLMPAAFVPAFPHDHSAPPSESSFVSSSRVLATPEGERRYDDLLFWQTFATFSGCPATVAPAGRTVEGLPVGVQILGPYLEDATPIELAGHLAELIGGFERPVRMEATRHRGSNGDES